MNNRPDSNGPPHIDPVPDGLDRPLWSVMIPTFNCAKYLRQTLESVLAQAPGPEQMQIEVVDDCSTKDDPEAVVREVGRGRVLFYRKPKNEGAIPNFNTCIQRSRGRLVHILHGDDYVLPRFYRQIESAAMRFPDCSLYSTQVFDVDESGNTIQTTGRYPELDAPTNDTSRFWYYCPIQCAGIVVRRSFYEAHGGFRTDLVHCADWEMWCRAFQHGGGMLIPDILACYRVFGGNDTARLKRTGRNLQDRLQVIQIFASTVTGYPEKQVLNALSDIAFDQAREMKNLKHEQAFRAALEFYREITPWESRLRRSVKTWRKRLLQSS